MTDHSKHHVIETETGSIRFIAGDVIDTRKDVLYCIDCCETVKEVKQSVQPSQADLEDYPF